MRIRESDFYSDQYNNAANWEAHYNGTAEEIIRQTNGTVTHFVAGLGTSGTFVGTSRRLKEFRGEIQCISVQPDSPLHGVEGLKHMQSAIVPGIYDPSIADDAVEISTEESHAMMKRLAREEGLFLGISSGANLAAALKIAKTISTGVVVTVLCDDGSRILERTYMGRACLSFRKTYSNQSENMANKLSRMNAAECCLAGLTVNKESSVKFLLLKINSRKQNDTTGFLLRPITIEMQKKLPVQKKSTLSDSIIRILIHHRLLRNTTLTMHFHGFRMSSSQS